MIKKQKKKYKSVIMQRIWKSARKLGTAVLVLAMFSSFMAMRGTNSGFSDEEKSENNTLTASSLDARASYVERFSVTGMTPEDQPNQNMKFANEGGLDFRYGINYRQTGGNDTLCNEFLLTAERNGVKVYNKLLLKDFNMNQFPLPLGSPFEIARFGHDNWNFKVELPADADSTLENKTCQWNFDFTAWQTDMPDATQGFSDTETVGTHSIATGEWLTAGDVVINEVMWMGSTASTADEWIELKNMTGSAIPIAGWKIENAGPSHGTITLPSAASIPANGYYLIANYAKTNVLSALNVDPNYIVNLSLNNTGNGNLVLKNNTTPALVIDSALGTPNWPAGCNDESGVCAGLRQSMERQDVPGTGLNVLDWHPCISGDANRLPYWDAIGNNYGTPKAPNLSPVVMNEIMFNPSDGDKEWAELYNISGEDIDVSGWYFENSKGDKIVISKENSDNNKNLDDEGETKVPSGERLVAYFEKEYLGNEKDEVSLYNNMGTPDDEADDVREDVYKYEDSTKKAGDSLMRIPDGVGIWIDPEATPGEENKLADKEMDGFRLLAYDKCFDGEKIKKDNKEEICAPAFLQYLEMIEELDDKNIKDATLIDILGMKKADEEKKLAALLAENATLTAGELPATDAPVTGEEAASEGTEGTTDEPISADEAVPAVVENTPTEEVIPSPDPTPAEPVAPKLVEDVAVPKEEAPAEKIEETPVDEPKETPAIETPVN